MSAVTRPDWWCYPLSCPAGHPWAPGRVTVGWMPCDCPNALATEGLGHLWVRCRTEGCSSIWYKPLHIRLGPRSRHYVFVATSPTRSRGPMPDVIMTLGTQESLRQKGDRVKRLVAASFAALVGASALFLIAASAAAPTVSISASRAPDAATVAAAHAAFARFVEAHETAVMPHNVTIPGAKPLSDAKPSSGTVTDEPTLNWSGFADASSTSTADDFTNVTGSWVIPAVQCPSGAYRNSGAYMVNWVGIDGFSDSTVEQLGSGAQCFEGVLYYYVWYEMYPNATVEEGTTACINDNVDCPRPGDRITASVQVTPGSSGENDYTLSLTDHTRPQESFTAPTQTCATDVCADASAEWIVERPAYAPGGEVQFVPLADYGKTGFTSGSTVANGKPSTIGGFSGGVYSLPMVDDSVSYFLDCPDQRAPVGVLPFNANDITENCPAAVPNRSGGFSVTWDTSF